ncbi:MAG: hypothetical protein IAG13_17260 [Deltaproteobacteria bacterium]|nr:hypothetical protein [Nannocystaceae bacterium]
MMRPQFHRREALALFAVLACEVRGSSSEEGWGEVTGGTGMVTSPMRATEGTDADDGPMSSPPLDPAGSETSSDGCAVGSMCLSTVPEDWFGPVAMHMGELGEAATPCGEAYPQTGLSLLSGYTDPGAAQCDCACNLDVSSSCTSYVYDYDASCSTFENFYQLNMDCVPAEVDGGAMFYMFAQGTPTCQGEVTETIPEPIWDAQVVTCRDPELGPECADGVCTPLAPEGFESGVCIYREGQQECPAGDYSVMYRHHSGVADDRDCSYCACGSGTGTCDGSLQIYGSDDCTGAAQAAALNVCTSGIVGGHSVSIAFTGDGSCPIAMPPMPTGTIAATGEFTFCCTP